MFVKSETRSHITVGTVDIPSGKVVVSDPLCYLAMGICCPVLKESIPAGSYPAEVAVVRNKDVGIRMCTARLKVKPTPAVYYSNAESVESNSVMLKGWVMSGFHSYVRARFRFYKLHRDRFNIKRGFADIFTVSAEQSVMPNRWRATL